MQHYNETEKNLKRFLKSKVKITMATVVGFLIAGTVVFGADSDKITWDSAKGVYDNKALNDLKTSKFVVGKDGNLIIKTKGSAYLLLEDLKNAKSLTDVRNALSQSIKHNKNYVDENNQGSYVITGALAGQGKYSYGVSSLQNLGKLAGDRLGQNSKKILEILDRTNTNWFSTIKGSTNTEIGDLEGKTSPVVIGLIGGDMGVGVGEINVPFIPTKITSYSREENLKITREGDSVVTVNSGNLIGGSIGSTAISLGNIKVEAEKDVSIRSFKTKVSLDLDLNGNVTTTINGNTELNLKGTANGTGITGGGLSTAIGGQSTSIVTGDTNINIDTIVNKDTKTIDGITVGLFGGGMSVSTLGGKAHSETNGKTNIDIKQGVVGGIFGGGAALSTDVSQFLKDKTLGGTLKDDKFTIEKLGIKVTVSGLNNGGTSTVNSKDTDINLSGNTSAAVILGSGLAVSHQNSPQGKAPTEKDKISTSTVEVENTNIVVNVNKNLSENKKEIPNIVSGIKGISQKQELVKNLQKIIENTRDKGIVVGIGGNGISIAADKGVSTVTAKNTNIDLKRGYVVGVLGNGISTGNAWTNSTTEVKEKSTIDINGAEVIGVSGNGLALYYGSGNYDGRLNFEGKVTTKVKDSEINLNSGSIDGLFGGGIAIDDSQSNKTNAEAITSGTSTINIKGGEVTEFGYKHLNGLMKTDKPLGTQDIKTYYKEVTALGEGVAIFGGGVAAGNMGKAYVENSVINISGGTVKGDIVAGGIATAGAISTVKNSTINITGGKIIGSLYGQGKATKLGEEIKSGVSTVENSNLILDGYRGDIKSIKDFHNIEVKEGTEVTTDEISVIGKVNKITAPITMDSSETRGKIVNRGVINISNPKDDSSRTFITLKDSDLENYGTIGVYLNDKVSDGNGITTNIGKIKIEDKTAEELESVDVSTLFGNEFNSTGMLIDKEGNVALDKDDRVIGNKEIEISEINQNEGIYLAGGVIIKGGEKPIDLKSLNIIGAVKTEDETTINDTTLNFGNGGNLTVTNLKISSGSINGNGDNTVDILFKEQASKLTLNNNTRVNGNIGDNSSNGQLILENSNIYGDTKVKSLEARGNSLLSGNLNIETTDIKGNLTLTFNSKLETGNTINIDKDGKLILQVANSDGKTNALGNSNGVILKGTQDNKEDIVLDTTYIYGKDTEISLGSNTFTDIGVGIINNNNGVYVLKKADLSTDGNKESKVLVGYNNELFKGNNILNNINNAAVNVSDYFEGREISLREKQLDTIYSSNIYAETVKASYENIKLSEETLLGMDRTAKTGDWGASGKVLYDKNQYDRRGTLGKSYDSTLETSGLLANLEYGVDDDTSMGFVFSGSKQNLDSNGGTSKGDIFYLGAYSRRNIGNYNFTAGAGYQLGKYNTDNKAGRLFSKTSYHTNSLSAYGQVKYMVKFDGVSFEPKVRLGYTYIEQDDIKDSYFKLRDADISTFDTTIGLDITKEIVLDRNTLRFVAGVNYTKLFGDTDKKFEGSFVNGGSFNVLGANLTENSVNFTLGTELENESGLFCNLGTSYTIGSNKTENYGVNFGIGYRF